MTARKEMGVELFTTKTTMNSFSKKRKKKKDYNE